MLASSIRQNDNVKGFAINNNNQEVKVSLLADDTVFFLDGSKESFDNLFEILNILNFGKTEAVWIGSKKGCLDFPALGHGIS